MPEGGDVAAHDAFMVPMCWTWGTPAKPGRGKTDPSLLGETEVHLRLSSYGSQIYVCVRESWARSMRTCALALRVQVRHKYMLSTCEKPIVICVQLLMKQGGDCVMHVMAATVLSVVKAPLGELGLDPSTWKSVHRAKRERAVRSV